MLWGISFHAVVVFGIGKDLLFKSVLGRCATIKVCLPSLYRDAVSGWTGWAVVYPKFEVSINPIPTAGGGRLCPPRYCLHHPPDLKPNDIPALSTIYINTSTVSTAGGTGKGGVGVALVPSFFAH